jgi:hypothetical protein
MNVETFSKIFAEEWSKYKTQAEKDISTLEKFNNVDPDSVPTFEEDPIKYILYSYPTLKESLEQLLTKDFLDYITGIYIIAPIPTTFKVILHNNQYFYMIYMGRTWMAKIAGKKYYLLNVGERGRAVESIARLLAMGSPMGLEPSQEAAENQTTESPLDTSGTGTETPESGAGAPPAEGPAEPEDQTAPLVESISKKKFLVEIAKKYPQAFRILTKQALILEGTFNQNSAKVVQRILSSEDNKEYGFLPMGKPNRISNPNKLDPSVFLDLLSKLYPNSDIKTVPPKVSPNIGTKGSSKFPMYVFDTEYGESGIILASGANKGEQYEKDFYESMLKNAGKSIKQIDNPELVQLYKTLGIDPSVLSEDNIDQTGKGNNKRQPSFEGPEDVGKIIADITINNGGDEIYLSIKDPKGSGIYNGGRIKFIKQGEDSTIYFDEDEFIGDNSVIKNMFTALSIDPQKIVNGLNDYLNKEGLPQPPETITNYDDTLLHNLLASSYGYGYWYVRQTTPGELKIVNIESPEDAYEMVGDIKSVKIKYPGINTKATEVRIETSSQLMGDNVYILDIRNSAGGILPGLKIKTLK